VLFAVGEDVAGPVSVQPRRSVSRVRVRALIDGYKPAARDDECETHPDWDFAVRDHDDQCANAETR